MILLLAVAIAMTVALLRGGKLPRLLSLPFRWPAVPLLAFAVQSTVIYFPASRGQALWYFHAVVLALSYLVLLLMVWVNRRIAGMTLIGLGLILNLAVMLANGGYMPIAPEAAQSIGHSGPVAAMEPGSRDGDSKDIVLPKDQTRLWILSDIFLLPRPFPLSSAFSVGDVVIAAGAFLTVQQAFLRTIPSGTRPQKGPVSPPTRQAYNRNGGKRNVRQGPGDYGRHSGNRPAFPCDTAQRT